MRSDAPVPTVGQVVAVVDAQLGSGLLRCLGPGCGGRLVRWGSGWSGIWSGWAGDRAGPAAAGAVRGVRGVAGAAARVEAAAQAVRGGAGSGRAGRVTGRV